MLSMSCCSNFFVFFFSWPLKTRSVVAAAVNETKSRQRNAGWKNANAPQTWSPNLKPLKPKTSSSNPKYRNFKINVGNYMKFCHYTDLPAVKTSPQWRETRCLIIGYRRFRWLKRIIRMAVMGDLKGHRITGNHRVLLWKGRMILTSRIWQIWTIQCCLRRSINIIINVTIIRLRVKRTGIPRGWIMVVWLNFVIFFL